MEREGEGCMDVSTTTQYAQQTSPQSCVHWVLMYCIIKNCIRKMYFGMPMLVKQTNELCTEHYTRGKIMSEQTEKIHTAAHCSYNNCMETLCYAF